MRTTRHGDLVSVTDRLGNVTRLQYDAPRPHYLTEVIDPLGRTGVRSEYDDKGRLVTMLDAAGNSVQLVHDPDNFVETVVDQLGNPTTYEYDTRGNIVTEVDALGGIITRTYDDGNNMLTETDPLGNTTRLRTMPVAMCSAKQIRWGTPLVSRMVSAGIFSRRPTPWATRPPTHTTATGT